MLAHSMRRDETSSERDVRQHFDARASNYSARSPWVNDPASLEPIRQWLDEARVDDVLEIGVGTGAVPAYLRATRGLPLKYFGLDISAAMLEHADGWTPVQGDAKALPFEFGTFDAVVVRQVLHYVEDLVTVLVGIKRVLRPRGLAIIAQIVPFDRQDDLTWWSGAVRLRQPLRRRALTADDLRSAIAAAGLAVEQEHEVLGRSSMRNWLQRYPVTPDVESRTIQHFEAAPSEVARIRRFQRSCDGDISFTIRWIMLNVRRRH